MHVGWWRREGRKTGNLQQLGVLTVDQATVITPRAS